MTDVQILAGNLSASFTDRVVSGLLLPYGELGNTNLGKFTVPGPGIFAIPNDVSVLMANENHDQTEPRARFLTATDTAGGVVASFKIGENPEGDALLQRIEQGARNGKPVALSVEVKDVVIRAAKALSGKITGAAFVERGAFPSAALMAADAGEVATPDTNGIVAPITTPAPLVPDDNGVLNIATTTTPGEVVVHPADGDPVSFIAAPDLETESPVGDATIPSTLNAAHRGASFMKSKGLTVRELGNLLLAHAEGTIDDDGLAALAANNGERLFATLTDVAYDGTGGLAPTISVPQWIGLVWSALKFNQQILPLFDHADLSSKTINGFKWTQKPSGGTWAGNKSPVNSNTLTVAPVTASASAYSIGHDIAREFLDFNVPGFFESYAAAVAEDYAKWADAQVGAIALAGATALAGDALTTLPGTTGGTIGSAASAIVDGAAALVTQGTLPSFALVAPALWKQMVKMPKSNVLGYLNASLGLSDGDLAGFVIRPSAAITAGKVLVGAKEAITVYELPGAPIRVDALDLTKGGVDKAAFGYLGAVVNDALGLRLVTAATS